MSMKAYEIAVDVTPDGKLELPEGLLELLSASDVRRMIILINEPPSIDEQDAWSRLAAEQFVAGYGEADAVYDRA